VAVTTAMAYLSRLAWYRPGQLTIDGYCNVSMVSAMYSVLSAKCRILCWYLILANGAAQRIRKAWRKCTSSGGENGLVSASRVRYSAINVNVYSI
jgi:hypothetical protein